MTHVFGKSLVRKFYPLEDGEPILLPSQVPAISLFSNQPSLADAIAGTGKIATHDVTYWSGATIAPYELTYTVPAINDPDPSSTTRLRGYWEVIRYTVANSGQVQTNLRYFEVERAKDTDSHPGTTADTLLDICPQAEGYFTRNRLDLYIDQALELMKLDFLSRQIEWGDLANLNKTKLALAYKALALAWTNQIQEDGDRFSIWANDFKGDYKIALQTISLEYDTDSDGKPDAEGPTAPSYRIFSR